MAVARPVVWGLEQLGKAVAVAGAAAMAAITGEAVKPDARTEEADCADTPDATECNQCKLGSGRIGQPPTARYITSKNRINYDYQLQIANMHAAPERFGYVLRGDNSNEIVNIELGKIREFFGSGGKFVTLEWMFGGIAFDGFWRSRCTVVEAKGNFGHFFDEFGEGKHGFVDFIVDEWAANYKKQRAVVLPAMPQGKLEWHFMHANAYSAATLEAGIPASDARLTPLILGRM